MKKLIVVITTILFISSLLSVKSDWSDSWEFDYLEQIQNEPQGNPQYRTQGSEDFTYNKKIVIDHNQVEETLCNFPILINISFDSDLADHCINDSGYDVAFYNSTNTTQYNHEIEKWIDDGTYVNATIWINITTLSSTEDTVLYMYYGYDNTNQQNVHGTWHTSYTAVYHMNDSTTAIIIDSSSNGHHGTKGAANQPIETAFSMAGDAQDFTATSSQYIDLTGDLGLGNSNFSIESWYNSDSTAANLFVLGYGDGDNGQTLYWRMSSDDEFKFGFKGNDLDTTDKFTSNIWYFFSGTFCTTGTMRRIYVNGSLNRGLTSGINLGVPDPTLGAIGYRPDDPSQYFDGQLDEIRVSNVNRSAGYMKTVYNSIINGTNNSFFTLGSEKETQSGTAPVVTTNSAAGVEETNATLSGTMTNNGTLDTTCWFIYGDETPPTDNNVSQGVVAQGDTFTYNWSSLTEGQIYYVDTAANNSEGFDSSGGIKAFLTKPQTPTGLDTTEISGGINITWIHGNGYNSSVLVRKTTNYPTSPTDGTVLYNGTRNFYEDTSLSKGTYYYRVWEYSTWTYSPVLQQFSDGNESLSYYYQGVFSAYNTSSFGGFADITGETIIVDINCTTWTIGNIDVFTQIRKNFTFYQNGTAEIDINITLNSTTLTFVSYDTWNGNGHNQYCANVTNDSWVTETNIDPLSGNYPTTWLNQNVSGDSNFAFGVRIWMPKTVGESEITENFVIWTTSWES